MIVEDLETALKNFVEAHSNIPPSTPKFTQRGQKRREDGSQTTQSSSSNNPVSQMKRNLAKELYDGIGEGELAEQFLSCIRHLDEVYDRNPQLKGWKAVTSASLEEILINTFLSTVNERRKSFRKSLANEEEFNHEKTPALHSHREQEPLSQTSAEYGTKPTTCPIVSDDQTRRILSALMPIEFGGHDSKGLWRYVLNTLLPAEQCSTSDLQRWFVEEVQRNTKSSYSAIVYCLSAPELSYHIKTPGILLRALLLSPLRGSTVEHLAGGTDRGEPFRESIRQLILELAGWRNDEEEYKKGLDKYAINHVSASTYPIFLKHLSQLLTDLRHGAQSTGNPPPVHIGYIKRCLWEAAEKVYVEKSLPAEHLDDLIHTTLGQRPELRFYVLETLLRKQHGDEERAARWCRFDSSKPTKKIKKFLISDEISIHQANSENFLSIPASVNIVHVKSDKQLKLFKDKLESSLSAEDRPILLGIDCEWSAYVSRSRASLLQIALGEDDVFLIDLDALNGEKELSSIMEKIFAEEKIMKIGLQLQEDLRQLREVITNCMALYQPENVVCIAKLVARLMELSSVDEKRHLIDEFFPPLLSSNTSTTAQESPAEPPKKREKLEDGSEVAELAEMHPTPTKSTINIGSLSLSTLCHRMLGKPLDKSEQRSVWTRRPLRSRQVRYAALDAHCLIQLYAKCREWAEKLGIEIKELCKEQGKIRHPIPLFWGRFNEIE